MNSHRIKANVIRKGGLSLLLIVSLLLLSLSALSAAASPKAQDGRERAYFSSNLAEDSHPSVSALPLQLELPDQAEVGDLVTFTLRGSGVQNLAGFQAELRFDDASLDLVEMSVLPDLSAAGNNKLVFGPVKSPGVVHLGAVLCPAADCSSTDYRTASRQPVEVGENAVLATFSFYVRLPGSFQIKFDNLQLVDAQGRSSLSSAPALQSPLTVDLEKLDITGNRVVNDSDAWMIISAWSDLVERGDCISPAFERFDVDGSGCVDVADAQMVLSHWGEALPLASAAQGLGSLATTTPGAVAATFTVNSNGDEPDAAKGDGVCQTAINGICTLRAAIEEANAFPGHDTITFDIRNSNSSCPALVVIQPGSSIFADAADNAGLTIDGYTQCNAKPNAQPVSGDAVIKIELKGNGQADVSGLVITSGNNLMRGLAVWGWGGDQMRLVGSKSQNNRVEGNFLGTDASITQTTSSPVEADGIRIANNASNNTVGGVTPAQRNIISGNDQDGLGMQTGTIAGNVVIGNYIGLKQDGATAWGNKADGVDLATGASNNIIGGLEPGQRNVISGNNSDGIEISHQPGVSGNKILGNFIGIRADGTQATPNKNKGITFEDMVTLNEVYRNVIAGNGGWGVRFYTANQNKVYDNFIGVLPTGIGPNDVIPSPDSVGEGGLTPMPNGSIPAENNDLSGVYITGGSQQNLLQNNIIANHPEYGIKVDSEIGYLGLSCEAYFNTFTRNRIYNNGKLGIYLKSGVCGETTYHPNQNIQPPALTNVNTTQAFGTTCPNCVVEVFISDKTSVPDPENAGEGKVFVGSSTADESGNFLVALSGVNIGQVLTATSTDGSGNTSMFATNVLVTTAGPEIEIKQYLPIIYR